MLFSFALANLEKVRCCLVQSAFALISKRSAASQGVAMGLSNSFMSLGRIIGPIWAGFIFDVNVNYPYLSGLIIMFAGFLISLVWLGRPDVVAVPTAT